MSQVLLIPGIGRMTFAGALRLLQPYSPRLAANFMDPAGSLYTDASRTTQVTTLGNRIRSFTNFVTGQPHGAATSDAKSPLWNSFTVNGRTVRGAVFDGSDDCLQVSGFDLSNTDEVCVIAGVRRTGTAFGTIAEMGAASGSQYFTLDANSSGSGFLRFGSAGSAIQNAAASGFTPPGSDFLVGIGDISGDLSRLIRNGIEIAVNNGDQGTGNYRNSTVSIGARSNTSVFLDGSISVLFILGAIPPDDVLNRVFRGLAPQIGVSV